MLRIYRRLWQVNWAEQWQYRANLLMYLLYWLVSPIVYLAVWTAVARGQGSVGGLTPNDFATYYLTLLVVDVLTSDITIHILAYKVQDGTLSSELLKPVHPILTGTLVNNLAFKVLNFMAFIPIWIILFLLFRPDYSSVTAGTILLDKQDIAGRSPEKIVRQGCCLVPENRHVFSSLSVRENLTLGAYSRYAKDGAKVIAAPTPLPRASGSVATA